MAIRRCPYCKAIIDESQKYCNNCGTQLLFPEDEANEEPIKGEKILDEDYKEEDSGSGFDSSSDDVGLEREEIDLDVVLKGGGHFPGEFSPSPPESPPITPATPPTPAASKRTLRPRKKPEPVAAKNDTKEEIARLIAALEEKEKKAPVPAPAKSDFPRPEPEPESKTPLEADFSRPELGPAEESPDLPANGPLPDPVSDSTSWEAMLRKPDTADLEKGPLPGAFDLGEEVDEAEPSIGDGSMANPTAGDTVDFEEELMRHTPPPPASPTRMGIPERVAGESTRLPLFGEEEPPRRERSRKSVFEEEHPPAFPVAAEAEEAEKADERPQRLGFFRKIGALIFDIVFIAAICLGSLWLAARMMDAPLFDLLTAARAAAGLYFLAMLFGYFFLFLFFLGETLGDKLASPRS